MGYVRLGVSLYSAGNALEAQRQVMEALRTHLPEEYQPYLSGDIEVEIEEHSGECSVNDCGRPEHDPEQEHAVSDG